jgi:hypothetical protein
LPSTAVLMGVLPPDLVRGIDENEDKAIVNKVQLIQEGWGPVEGDKPFRAVVGFICWRSTHSAVREAMVFFNNINSLPRLFIWIVYGHFQSRPIEAFAGRVNKAELKLFLRQG